MIAVITTILFGIPVVIFAFSLGKAKGRVEERLKKPRPVHPICPCEHVWGEHKDGGRCAAQVKRPYYASWGSRNGYEWVNCACTKYHGPVMVTEEFFHPGTVIQ